MLVVAIHDVDLAALAEVRWLLARLDQATVRPRVLLVVPARGGVELRPDSELMDLLRGEEGAGSEIVVHGYTHRAEGPILGSGLAALRGRLFAPADAEFLTVSREEGRQRLVRGREVLESAGLRVSGFCAPGWLAPGWIDATAREAGYGYVIGMVRISDLLRGRSRYVPGFGYMGADTFQERLVSVGGAVSVSLNRRLGRQVPHLTAFLHPARAPLAPGAAHTLERIAGLAGHLPLVTYTGLLEGWQRSTPADAGA